MPLAPGTQLGSRYEILSLLGSGGMGEVYRAKDLRLGRNVAIKILPEHLASNPEALSRFQREARAVAALSHANILAIHDFVIEQNLSFAVMELLEGQTLRQLIYNSPIPWRKATEIAIDIAEGLSAAHSEGLIHRDLKPENIFITSHGHVKILDFGLAQWKPKALSQELSLESTLSRLTQTGMVVGTLPYLSPEQLRGTSVDQRTDIFSFGCVLFEMLNGTRAFRGKTAPEIMAAILKEEPKFGSRQKSEVPDQLHSVLSRCLKKNPEERFQSAQEVAFVLKTALAGPPALSRLPAISLRLFHPAIWITVVALALLYVSIYIISTRQKSIHSVAILPFTNESSERDNDYLSDGITSGIIDSLTELPELKVTARSTVFHYKNDTSNPQKVGHDLSVQAVLVGTMVQEGNIIKIRTELVDVRDGSQIWTKKYSWNIAELPEVESEISTEIAQTLRLKLSGDQKEHLTEPDTENAQAYQLCLRGGYENVKATEEGYEKARGYYQKAIDLDPGYARAYSGLGDTYFGIAADGYRPPQEAWPKAQVAYKQALKIDPAIPACGPALASIKFFYDWNWAEAEREFKRYLNPTKSGTGHRFYSWFLVTMKRYEEAIEQARIAEKLNPYSKQISLTLGQVLTYASRYDEAIVQFRKILDLDPNYDAALFSLVDAYEQRGMWEEAISTTRRAYLIVGNDEAAELFETVQGKSGYEEAQQIIAQHNLEILLELSKTKYISPLEIAAIYSKLNQKDKAFEWLERAYQERSALLVFLNVKRDWDNLRSDPRFSEFVKRMRLP
jgi:serine/threonine-protein kinase